MPIKQSYAQHGDACATAHAMELLGDKWTYPVLRELMLGPKRFGQLAASVRGITPAVLTARLREMTRNGLVQPSSPPPPANVAVYELTDWARELSPVFESLGRWAQASPTRTIEGGGLTPDAAVQSMLTMAPHQLLNPPIDLTLHLYDGRLPDDEGYRYRARWAAQLEITRGTDADITRSTVRADSSTWAQVLYQDQPLDGWKWRDRQEMSSSWSPPSVARLLQISDRGQMEGAFAWPARYSAVTCLLRPDGSPMNTVGPSRKGIRLRDAIDLCQTSFSEGSDSVRRGAQVPVSPSTCTPGL